MEVVVNKKRNIVSLIDEEDLVLLKDYDFCYSQEKNRITSYVWAIHRVTKKKYRLHRLIMKATSKMKVDHINHNTLDNRKSNLRLCTENQNKWNRTKYKCNTSGYKGVMKLKSNGKFIAAIMCNNKRYHLGTFNTAEEAALEYNKAAILLHNKFACINKIVTK